MPFDLQAQNQKFQLFSHDLRGGLSWRLFIFFLITFSVAVLSYFGLEYGYKAFLQKSIADYDGLIKESTARVGLSEQKNLISFYSQIVNLRSLFRSHVVSSNIFKFLEDGTSPRVTYASAGLSLPDRELTLDGVTDSYDTLVSQVATFEKANGVEKVLLGNNSFDGAIVKFSMKITFSPQFFLPVVTQSRSDESQTLTSLNNE